MPHSKEINHSELVDPQSLLDRGECPYTFLAFPASAVDENGLPTDLEARQYIARVQSEGVPIGIWLDTPIEDTGYAFRPPRAHQNAPRCTGDDRSIRGVRQRFRV
ncbi:hypothetical protein [Roseiconus lacunae]|uniref:Uncharacterized protein n=1 Tax=Roseiconus lacunae TaxID=2605694 RepID=A0ABT7PBB9_9BACT|nr:hypothetical protein [Roseiconus lacunae]MDM4013799.1 hypothetical protein [Roseiconus lacunae]